MGAFIPATGEALTVTYTSRSIVTFADFLEKFEAWAPDDIGRIYAIMDNLRAHDVSLFNVAHPGWEFVFQPKYAACLNLIEPWWKTLRSVAVAGRFFETWQQIGDAIERARDYWNAHRHPYVWGRRVVHVGRHLGADLVDARGDAGERHALRTADREGRIGVRVAQEPRCPTTNNAGTAHERDGIRWHCQVFFALVYGGRTETRSGVATKALVRPLQEGASLA